MKIKSILLGAVASIALTSCGSMGIVSTPSQYVNAGEEVGAERLNTNILKLTALDSDAASKELLEELKGKCPSGVTNIRTTHSVQSFFIFDFEKLQIKGNCK